MAGLCWNLWVNRTQALNTARRAIRYVDVYDFDIISLDYNLDGPENGDVIAEFIKRSCNAESKVLVHSTNAQGVKRIQAYLPNSVAIPISKIIRDNQTFRRFRQSININLDMDWSYIFKRKDTEL